MQMCICPVELVDELLDSNYHGNWVWVGFEIVPPGLSTIEVHGSNPLALVDGQFHGNGMTNQRFWALK